MSTNSDAPIRLRVSHELAEGAHLDRAARAIQRGALVAFPTETVYGLGADALNPEAVGDIFRAKGRPETHPLIVHVGSCEAAAELAEPWPPEAKRLVERFWPGPLTIIVPRAERLPAEVTGGLETVGLRMPAHPVGLEFVRRAERPVAAPSANPHTKLSPTRAEHVVKGLGDAVDVIVDGGPTEVGIESTVLSLAVDPPAILRPGAIGRDELASVLGAPVAVETDSEPEPDRARPSPGLSSTHYAPETPLRLLERESLRRLGASDRRVGALVLDPSVPESIDVDVVEHLSADPEVYAEGMYEALHRLDRGGCEVIAVEYPPRDEAWRAIWNRLRRAAELGDPDTS